MDPTQVRVDNGWAWTAAVDLANRLATGERLPTIPSTALLDQGEVLHADLPANGWRFHPISVTYESPSAIALGGPLTFGIIAASSATARRHVRREAEAVAAPQWRPLGELRILTTDRRLLVWHEGAWASVWYNAIRELHPDIDATRLDMTFDEDPPYCLAGPWVPYLTVIVTTVLAQHRGIDAVTNAIRYPIIG
ncbi:MAG: hypothetical protein KDB26_14515 [Microthrixaceae bacterium]|nr:hypothetical protein [Microthrixaceae bacterium]